MHEVHRTHMREVGGDPIPKAFFEELDRMDGRVLVLSLYLRGEYVGSFLELLDEARNTVHGFVVALKPSFYDEHVSELMYDAVIRWAQDAGFARYDFGGATGDVENGIFRFKRGFGGALVPNFYWERGFGPAWPALRKIRTYYLRLGGGE